MEKECDKDRASVRDLLAYAAMLSEPDPELEPTRERMEEINRTVFQLGHILKRAGL